MREVHIKINDHVTMIIKSPWLSPENAATYLGISRSEFDKVASTIPCKGFGNRRRFNVSALDTLKPKEELQRHEGPSGKVC